VTRERAIFGRVITDAEAEIHHGTRIGRFVVVGELGKGGMGVVYAAKDRELDRQVALKVLRAAAATEEERMRMLREGQAMARITHPNVITVYEVGVEGSLVFLAQELLDAGTLREWLDRPRTQAEIVAKFVEAGRGLAAAHAAGLVHRDFKPDNVLLGTDGRVRVADFGLARALDAEEGLPASTRANMARAQLELSRNPMSPLTRTGAVMGTPMFMAPEQHNGERADERSDQFAFCIALYHALHGDWPFAGKTAVALADAVIEGRLQKPPSGHGVPRRLRRILLRGLATARDDRYPTMEALLADLTRPPSRFGRRLAVAVGALALVGVAVGAGYILHARESGEPTRAAPPPIASFNAKAMSTGAGNTWLLATLERGLLDDIVDKYGMAAALMEQNGDRAQASIARSASALALALRGRFGPARASLRDAIAGQGHDPTALAYVDLATAAISLGSGELDTATRHAASCAKRLSSSVPELAALCFELEGDAIAAAGDVSGARQAYQSGLLLDRRTAAHHRSIPLQLAIAALDVADKPDAVATKAAGLQVAAAEEGAVSSEASAWILLGRAHLASGSSQQALDDLQHVKSRSLQAFEPRLVHQLVTGEAYVILGDPDDGFKNLDAAAKEAAAQGFRGVALQARLARVEAMVAQSMPEAEDRRAALIRDARQQGYLQIVHLAETAKDR